MMNLRKSTLATLALLALGGLCSHGCATMCMVMCTGNLSSAEFQAEVVSAWKHETPEGAEILVEFRNQTEDPLTFGEKIEKGVYILRLDPSMGTFISFFETGKLDQVTIELHRITPQMHHGPLYIFTADIAYTFKDDHPAETGTQRPPVWKRIERQHVEVSPGKDVRQAKGFFFNGKILSPVTSVDMPHVKLSLVIHKPNYFLRGVLLPFTIAIDLATSPCQFLVIITN